MRHWILAFLFFAFSQHQLSAQQSFYYDVPYYDNVPPGIDTTSCARCLLDLYIPGDTVGFATVVWFHGGGMSQGSKELPAALLQQGIAVAGIGYRLTPDVSSPAYIQDAAAAVAWIMKHIADYGGDPDLIFLSGHSAGGYLASMVGLDRVWLSHFGMNADQLAGLIPLSGHTITHFSIRAERGIPGERAVVDELAPLFHVRRDAPPVLLITGDRELELLGRYEENAYMMRMMRISGHNSTQLIELQGYDHNMVAPALPLLLKEVRRVTLLKKSNPGL